MRHIINILVSIATICQFFASVFNMLNMKKPETIEDSLYNDFVLIGCYNRTHFYSNIQFQM